MAVWTYILLGAFLLGLIGVIVWLLLVFLREKEVPSDDNLDVNFCSHLDGSGRFLISEKDVEATSYNDRNIITGVPRDVDWKKLNKLGKNLEEVKVIGEQSKMLLFPKGTLSRDKNIKFILPPEAEDLPSAIKDTLFGKLLAEIIEGRNIDKTLLSIVREGSSLKTQYLDKLGDGEISMSLIDEYEKVIQHLKELLEKKQQTFGATSTSNI